MASDLPMSGGYRTRQVAKKEKTEWLSVWGKWASVNRIYHADYFTDLSAARRLRQLRLVHPTLLNTILLPPAYICVSDAKALMSVFDEVSRFIPMLVR